MAEQIKFREGVSQLGDSSLNAPYDLRNAYIEPSHIIKALNRPSSESGIVAPSTDQHIVKHNGEWVLARADAYYRSILYASTSDPEGLDVYPKGQSEPESDVPRIVDVETKPGATDAVPKSSDGSYFEPKTRIIIYALLPVNKRGEVGTWDYKAYKTNDSNPQNPILTVRGTDQVQYVEVYRTAAMPEDVSGTVANVQAFHYLGRYSGASGGEGVKNDYYTGMPHSSVSETPANYHDQTGIDYIYPSSINQRVDGNTAGDVSLSGLDLSNYRLVFKDLYSTSNLSTGTEYTVQSNTDYKITIGTTFDVSDILKEDAPTLNRYTGVLFELLPPIGVSQTGSEIVIIDGKTWVYDQPENTGDRPHTPSSRILERDRTLHGRTQFIESATGEALAGNDRFNITGGDYTEFYPAGNVVTFSVTGITTTTTASGDVQLSGTATPTIVSGTSFIATLDLVTEKTNGNHELTYSIQGGTANYTAELQRRSVYSTDTSDFTTVTTNTETSTGQYTITDTDVDEDSSYNYRVKVTDTNGNTDTTTDTDVFAERSDEFGEF